MPLRSSASCAARAPRAFCSPSRLRQAPSPNIARCGGPRHGAPRERPGASRVVGRLRPRQQPGATPAAPAASPGNPTEGTRPLLPFEGDRDDQFFCELKPEGSTGVDVGRRRLKASRDEFPAAARSEQYDQPRADSDHQPGQDVRHRAACVEAGARSARRRSARRGGLLPWRSSSMVSGGGTLSCGYPAQRVVVHAV